MKIFGKQASYCNKNFYAPRLNDCEHIDFVLSFCLSVVSLNLQFNFLTLRDRDFILGMHIPLMMLFQ